MRFLTVFLCFAAIAFAAAQQVPVADASVEVAAPAHVDAPGKAPPVEQLKHFIKEKLAGLKVVAKNIADGPLKEYLKTVAEAGQKLLDAISKGNEENTAKALTNFGDTVFKGGREIVANALKNYRDQFVKENAAKIQQVLQGLQARILG